MKPTIRECDRPVLRPAWTPQMVVDYEFEKGFHHDRVSGVPLDITRASDMTFWNGSKITTVGSNKPALVTSKGLLVAPGTENKLLYCNSFNNWTGLHANLSSETIIAPDGSDSARGIIRSDVEEAHRIYHSASQFEVVAGETWALSILAKAGASSYIWPQLRANNEGASGHPSEGCSFNLTDGIVSGSQADSASIISLKDGWYLCVVIGTVTITGMACVFIYASNLPGDGETVDVWISGVQAEKSSVRTPLVVTTTATASRAAQTNSTPLTQKLKSLFSVHEGSSTVPQATITASNAQCGLIEDQTWMIFDDTDLSEYAGHVIQLKDSSDNVILTGVASRAGTGETLGDELLSNPSFDTDTTSWSSGNDALVDSVEGGQTGNCLEVTEDGTAEPYASNSTATTIPNALYKHSVWVKQGTESSFVTYPYIPYVGSRGSIYGEATSEWAQKSNYLNCENETYIIYVLKQDAEAESGTTILFDEASVKQVIEPPTTGLVLTNVVVGSGELNDISEITVNNGSIDSGTLSTDPEASFVDALNLSPLAYSYGKSILVYDSAGDLIAGGFVQGEGSGVVYSAELVVNGDMELESGWDDWGTPTTSERSDTRAHGGTYSWHVVSTESNQGIYQSLVGLIEDGSLYEIDSYHYVESGTANLVFYDSSGGTGDYYTSLGEWGKINFKRTAEEGEDSPRIKVATSVSGDFYTDDLSIRQILNPSETGLECKWTFIGSGNPNDVATFRVVDRVESRGTAIVGFEFNGWEIADLDSPTELLSIVSLIGGAGLLYRYLSNLGWFSYDYSNVADYNINPPKNQLVYGMVQWDSVNARFRVGFCVDWDDGAWGDWEVYDGAFLIGTHLRIGNQTLFPLIFNAVKITDLLLSGLPGEIVKCL